MKRSLLATLRNIAYVSSLITSCDVYGAAIDKSAKRDCAFDLSGTVQSGDADKLLLLLANHKIDSLDERTGAICLKSNGGSYVEGLKLAELVYLRGMSTVIEPQAECFSACALIFLGGTITDQVSPSRKLSFGGLVGFHAPYRRRSDPSTTAEDPSVATDGMRQAILALMKFAAQRSKFTGNDIVKPSLLTELISKGPTEAFFIKTVYDAARWDSQLYDIERFVPTPRPSDEIKNLCLNFHSANMDRERPLETALTLDVKKYSSKYKSEDYRVLVSDLRTKDLICEVYPRTMKGDQHVTFFACSFDYWSNKNFGDCKDYRTAPAIRVGNFVPKFFSYSPELPLLKFRRPPQ